MERRVKSGGRVPQSGVWPVMEAPGEGREGGGELHGVEEGVGGGRLLVRHLCGVSLAVTPHYNLSSLLVL